MLFLIHGLTALPLLPLLLSQLSLLPFTFILGLEVGKLLVQVISDTIFRFVSFLLGLGGVLLGCLWI